MRWSEQAFIIIVRACVGNSWWWNCVTIVSTFTTGNFSILSLVGTVRTRSPKVSNDIQWTNHFKPGERFCWNIICWKIFALKILKQKNSQKPGIISNMLVNSLISRNRLFVCKVLTFPLLYVHDILCELIPWQNVGKPFKDFFRRSCLTNVGPRWAAEIIMNIR